MGKKTSAKKAGRSILVAILLIAIVCAIAFGVQHKRTTQKEDNVIDENLVAELENFVSTDELNENDVDMEEVLDIMEQDENLVAKDIKNSNLENKKDAI